MTRVSKHLDFIRTGPKTLAGKYLRMFWQPVFCSHELAAGRAVPIRILGEDLTLYRGESGTPHVIGFRCAHRKTQLSIGWIEGDCLRCFYHGWKYDGSGQCVEQPAEPKPFAEKIRIPGYPVQEYLGLIFVYLGKGEAPPLPRYPKLEGPGQSLDTVRLDRICNYFNNIDNSLDNAHVRFVHGRHRETARDEIVKGDPMISVAESEWGVKRFVQYPDGKTITAFFGMPNINYLNGQVVDAEIKRADLMVFKVPVDDENHVHFEVRSIPFTGDRANEWLQRRREKRAKEAANRADLVREVLKGRLHLNDIDPNRTDYVMFEDEIAQTGQGSVPDRSD
ncbi:MAG TPA: Rieske 2Fe-2S domain-containing protein, partial [Candidatus Acidoferrales bacterium]|nr:Rieske 2Fe-2S domain-containing protein [Candidatus Acidoferrales bacterium]